MKKFKKYLTVAAALITSCTAAIMPFKGASAFTSLSAYALDLSNPIDSDRYTDNAGDSFINTIGTRNGYTTINGTTYSSGIEMWVARWNFTDEKSWVWAEYAIDPSMTDFTGTLSVLKDSHNTESFNTTLEISLDGEVVYTYKMTPGFSPQKINIDLTGASNIKFSVYDNEFASGGTSFCIGTGKGFMLGDVDRDGAINATDASLVLKNYAMTATGKESIFDDEQKLAADVVADGNIDAVDASRILAYYAYKATGGDLLLEDYLKK